MISEERRQFIEDIYITAREGGIDYWGKFISYNKYGLGGIILDTEDNIRYPIGIQRMEKALEKFCYDVNFEMNKEAEITVMLANKYNDASDIDADIADFIIQLAIFDEIRYC